MIRQLVILAPLVLLCAGEDQGDVEASTLHDVYLNKCKKFHRNSQNLEVYYHNQGDMCKYYCGGSDADGNKFYVAHNKDDGIKCTGYVGAKEGSVCSNGVCVLISSVETCKNELGGQVTGVEDYWGTFCKINCSGHGDKKLDVRKPKGTTCIQDFYAWRPASCTESGYCRKDTVYIPSSKDSTSKKVDIAFAECKRRHSTAEGGVNLDESACEYFCLFNEGKNYYEFLTFQDGYSCGDGKECVAANCHSKTDIEKCKSLLDEPLIDIKFEECTLICVGETKAYARPQEPNAFCRKLDGSQAGMCNENAECIPGKDK